MYGHEVGQNAAAVLRAQGRSARYLDGGIEGFVACGGPTLSKSAVPGRVLDGRGRWLTVEDPSNDALACAWLIRRFIDPLGEIFVVPAEGAKKRADEIDAKPFALHRGRLRADGNTPALEAMIEMFDLQDPTLRQIADLVNAADRPNQGNPGNPGNPGDPDSAAGVAAALGSLRRKHGGGEGVIVAALPIIDGLFAAVRRAGAPV